MRILVVDDFRPYRQFVSSVLQQRPEWQVICEVPDGLEAVQRAEELQPDLILLDIGLPKLNGIDAARRIKKLVPQSKIVFLSQESSVEVVHEAIRLGAQGYILKAHAPRDLLVGMEAVLEGKQFVSSGLDGNLPGST